MPLVRLSDGRLKPRIDDGKVVPVNDLTNDLKDGYVLYHLLEILSETKEPKNEEETGEVGEAAACWLATAAGLCSKPDKFGGRPPTAGVA